MLRGFLGVKWFSVMLELLTEISIEKILLQLLYY